MKTGNTWNRLTATVLSVLLVAVVGCPIAFASDKSNSDQSGYITFDSEDERMASNGKFTFEFCYNLKSDRFRANGTSIRIDTSAYIYNRDTKQTSTDSSKKFHLALYHDGIFDTYVGGYYGYADGVYGGLTFNNLEAGDKYYFVLYPDDPNMSRGPYMFTGSGQVTGVTVL